MGIAEQAHK